MGKKLKKNKIKLQNNTDLKPKIIKNNKKKKKTDLKSKHEKKN